MKGLSILAFLPQEALPLFFVGCGLVLIFGFRKLAATLFTMGLIFAFLPVLIDPILDLLPESVLYVLFALICLSLLGTVVSLFVGEKSKNRLAWNSLKWMLFQPFRIIGRGIFGRRI